MTSPSHARRGRRRLWCAAAIAVLLHLALLLLSRYAATEPEPSGAPAAVAPGAWGRAT